MAECPVCSEPRYNRNLYPALAIAALAGVAFTYFLTRKGRTEDSGTPLEKVMSVCESAAEKLDAMAGIAQMR